MSVESFRLALQQTMKPSRLLFAPKRFRACAGAGGAQAVREGGVKRPSPRMRGVRCKILTDPIPGPNHQVEIPTAAIGRGANPDIKGLLVFYFATVGCAHLATTRALMDFE